MSYLNIGSVGDVCQDMCIWTIWCLQSWGVQVKPDGIVVSFQEVRKSLSLRCVHNTNFNNPRLVNENGSYITFLICDEIVISKQHFERKCRIGLIEIILVFANFYQWLCMFGELCVTSAVFWSTLCFMRNWMASWRALPFQRIPLHA